jgi:diguanylate cyclase (GGDEF)-like protein
MPRVPSFDWPSRFRRPSWRSLRRAGLALVFGTLIGGAVAYADVHDGGRGARGPLSTFDTGVHDLIVSMRRPESYLGAAATTGPNRDPRNFITIVAIDERTLSELGAYSGGYPRAYHAALIDSLLKAPPRVIALDVGFFESTPDDAELAAALDRARGLPVPTSVVLGGAGLDRVAPEDSTPGILTFRRGLLPTPVLAERADIALANVLPDERGTIRVMPLVANVDGVERPTLGLAAIARYLRRPGTLDGRPDATSVQFAGRTIPVDVEGSARINFFGPPSRPYAPDDTFRVVSFVDVLRGRVDPNVWRGGLVFVGALGATGLADDYWTPVSQQGRKMAGVEIHANTAATLFSSNFLREMPVWAQVALTVSVAAVLAVLAGSLELLVVSIACPLLLLAFAGLGTWGLHAQGIFVPLSAPLLAGFSAFLGAAGPRAVAANRTAKVLRETLASERAEAAYQARHDPLSGLANRAELVDTLLRAVLTERQRGGSGALLLLNLDQFKEINDTLGHAGGDALLIEVARRLRALELGSGTCVARIGGDEFAVVLPDADLNAGVSASVLLLRALEVPFDVADQQMLISASIGVVVFPQHGDDPEVLLRRSDMALQRAKEAHTGYATFAANQEEQSSERLSLVASLRRAVTGDGLLLYCQPKVECGSGRVAGAEALVRWQHPERGMIPPDQFIPLAEKTGLVRPLTRWVLQAAVDAARTWIDQGLPTPLAVNLSTHDLQDLDLPDYIGTLLADADLPPEMLSVEITETALLADPARAQEVLDRICALGVRASLDDFGTGYSSLTYLKQFPLKELKIDRSFVQDMTRGPRDREIVRSTIELGHRLGLSVVAEGIEDSGTLRLLAELGCDLAQGYHLSRPMPCAELPAWIRARAPHTPQLDAAA